MVYYLPSGAGKGTWYPRLPEPQVRDMRPLPSVELKQEGVMEDPLPVEWTRLRDGETVDNDGIYGRHFISTVRQPTGAVCSKSDGLGRMS